MKHEITKLLSITILPAIIGITISYLIGLLTIARKVQNEYLKHDTINEKILFIFKPHPKFNLIRQPSLYLALLVPIFYSLSVGTVIWSNYHLDISENGIITFWEISKLPISIFATCIPLSILVARIHSSEQISLQIELAEEKNNFELYYMHKEKFTQLLNETVEIPLFIKNVLGNEKLFDRIELLYNNFFPESNNTDGFTTKCSTQQLNKSRDLRNSFIEKLSIFSNSRTEKDASHNYGLLRSDAMSFMSILGANNVFLKMGDDGSYITFIGENEIRVSYIDLTVDNWFSIYQLGFQIYATICIFSHIDSPEYRMATDNSTSIKEAYINNSVLKKFRDDALKNA